MNSVAHRLLLCLLLGACSAAPPTAPSESQVDVRCEEPRPEMCTREYRPVCALRDTGTRCVTTPCSSTEWKTYGNACDACADEGVIGHVPGSCSQ